MTYPLTEEVRGLVIRLREVYDYDKSCLNASHTVPGELLSFDICRRLKMDNIIGEDISHYFKIQKVSALRLMSPHLLPLEVKKKYPFEYYCSHLNSFIHGNMSLMSRHAGTRAFYSHHCYSATHSDQRFPCWCGDSSINNFLFRDRLCRKLMDQMSYVFGVKMYIRDHSNKLNPSTYIRMDLEDKPISDSDGLPDLEDLDDMRHKDLLIRSTVLKDKHLYEYEHDVAVIW